MQWHGDTAIPFKQEANFWYVTGIQYADWRLIIDGKQNMSWLVAPQLDEVQKLFDGGLENNAAKTISGVDAVLNREEGERLLQQLAREYRAVYTIGAPRHLGYASFIYNPAPESMQKELKSIFATVKDCQPILASMRAIKQPEEIAAMDRAAALSIEAFELAKASLPDCRHEYEVEAELTYHFRRHNATHAFEPIIAGGKNACTLHYTANTGVLQNGELLLIDAGAHVDGYPADITRTFAIHEPTPRARAVHEAVQLAERRIVELIRPSVTFEDYHKATDSIMKEALISVGLMKDEKDTSAYRRYFPHAISHGLGADVHESLGGFKEFRSGMVLTVEPGIYIPEEGIGVRIEDTILVTDERHRNLTAHLSTDI